MSYIAKMLPVLLTVLSAAAQAQSTPYTANVVEDPYTGKYVKANVVVAPELVESHFGDKRVWVLGGGTAANVTGKHEQLNGASNNAMELGINVMAGQFVAKDVLLGLQGGVSSVLSNELGSKTLLAQQVGPFAGYNARMTEHSSFLPTLAVLYDYTQTWAPADEGSHGHKISVEADLGFSLNMTRHINILVGPYVAQSVYNHANLQAPAQGGVIVDTAVEKPWTTTFGVKASVLGWL